MKPPVVALLFLLAGCSPARPYETVIDGTWLFVDTEKRVVSDGTYEYPYAMAGDVKEVIYPDDIVYHEQKGVASYNGAHDERYVDGEVLLTALDGASAGKPSIFPVALIVAGLFHLAMPAMAWRASRAYVFFRGEPSKKASLMTRLAGLGVALAGFAMLAM